MTGGRGSSKGAFAFGTRQDNALNPDLEGGR